MNLGSLYQEVILDHAKHPHNYGELDGHTHAAHRLNPTCGDTVAVQLVVSDETITAIKFNGRGCAISQASASMLTDLITGKTLKQAHQIMRDFQGKMMDTDIDFLFDDEAMEELEALGGVRQFPNRIRCATLAWHALEDALSKDNS
jgi:nitrogen fixation protein NifU and related proteins